MLDPDSPFHPFGAEKTRVVEGAGCLGELGKVAGRLGATRALVVSDPGVVAAGHAVRAMQILAQAGVVPQLFAEVNENPTTEDVDRGLAAALPLQPDLFVAVGGGSAIDVAKGVNFLLTCGGRMQDYWGHDKATKPLIPMVAVPTTAGTGSEVQSFALIGDPITHQKMACGDPSAAPRVALLDPELTVSMPPFVTACTALDTVGHAVESAVSTKRSGASAVYSRAAFALSADSFERVLQEPQDLVARARLLRAAAYAGLAIEHSMLGAAHSLANPLTAHLRLPHGQAVATALPVVVEWNANEDEARQTYADLMVSIGRPDQSLPALLRDWVQLAGWDLTLPERARKEGLLGPMAEEAARQWTAQFNPRAIDSGGFLELLEQLAG